MDRAIVDDSQGELPFAGPAPPAPKSHGPTPDDRRLTITVEEAGRRLGISRSLAYAAARAGTLPTIRFGRRLLVPMCQLDALLAGRRAPE